MAIVDPRDLAGLRAWYSAEAETGYTDGQQVTGWTDRSGLGNHATLSSAGTVAPKWRSGLGPTSFSPGYLTPPLATLGAPCIKSSAGSSSDSSAKYFVLPNLLSGATSAEIFYVMRGLHVAFTSGFHLFGPSTSDVSYYPLDSGQIYDTFCSTTRAVISADNSLTNWQIYNSISGPGDRRIYMDIGYPSPVTEYSSTTNAFSVVSAPRIMDDDDSFTRRFTGEMACVLVFNGILTTDERSDVNAWLSRNLAGGVPGVTTVTGLSTPRIYLSSHSGYFAPPSDMTVQILDPAQRRSPTAITVVVSGGIPDAMVGFSINGGTPYYVQADYAGDVNAVSIAVPGTVGAGTHTLTVTTTGGGQTRTASASFTIQTNPTPRHVPGPDADPVEVPGTLRPNGSRSWVFQDLMPDGLGSWILPRNPSTSKLEVARRVLEPRRTTAQAGKHHIFEGRDDVGTWTFGGIVCTQEEQEMLEAYADLNRRFYIIDHLNRAWQVAITNLEPVPRLRSLVGLAGETAEYTDWVADNTVTALVYGSAWQTPVGP